MAITTSTTTAVELSPLPPLPNSSGHNRFHNDVANSEAQTSSSDDVLEASRLADSEVPDGGYGWVVLTGCAVLAWWVSISVDISLNIAKSALLKEASLLMLTFLIQSSLLGQDIAGE